MTSRVDEIVSAFNVWASTQAQGVKGTDLMSTIRNRVASQLAQSGAFKGFPFPLAMPKFEVSIFWHQKAHENPVNLWMRNQLIELFATKDTK